MISAGFACRTRQASSVENAAGWRDRTGQTVIPERDDRAVQISPGIKGDGWHEAFRMRL